MDGLFLHSIGLMAAAIGSASYLLERPRAILVLHAVSWGFWAIYFLSLGGVSGVGVAGLSVVVSLVGAFGNERLMRWTSVTALLPVWVLGFYLHGDAAGILSIWMPILASTIETLSIAVRDRLITFRAMALAANVCWFLFGVAVGAHVSVGFALINAVVLVITSIRILRKRAHAAFEAPA